METADRDVQHLQARQSDKVFSVVEAAVHNTGGSNSSADFVSSIVAKFKKEGCEREKYRLKCNVSVSFLRRGAEVDAGTPEDSEREAAV